MNYFTVDRISVKASEIFAEIVVKHKSHLFDGHFPNAKILPGVGYLPMINEVLSEHFQMTWQSRELSYAKFLKPLILKDDQRIETELALVPREECLKIKAVFQQKNQVLCKIAGAWVSRDSYSDIFLSYFS